MDQEELITCTQTALREFTSGAMMGLQLSGYILPIKFLA